MSENTDTFRVLIIPQDVFVASSTTSRVKSMASRCPRQTFHNVVPGYCAVSIAPTKGNDAVEQIRRFRRDDQQLTGATPGSISEIVITPVAFHDAPLLNSVGVHEPFALRAIIEVVTADGTVGLGETYGDAQHIQRLALAAEPLLGLDITQTNEMRRRVIEALENDTIEGGHGMSGMVTGTTAADRVLSPFEVAALDIRGRQLGVWVSELLGGRVRDRVELSGYLFYKWGGHLDAQGQPGADDTWGAALDPEGIGAQARTLIDRYGFTALKLKGGVFPPDEEVAAILALREAFPDVLLRIDPNGAWNVESSVKVAEALEGVIEYLEDPTVGSRASPRCASARASRSLRTCTSSRSTTFAPRSSRARSTSCSATTTSGAASNARSCLPASARPSTGACRCTRTRTSASASRR